MSECCTKGRKRKRSLQDTPVDLGKMRLAMNRLGALKEELNDIEETENEMDAIMAHVAALEEILRGAKKPVSDLSLCDVYCITEDYILRNVQD